MVKLVPRYRGGNEFGTCPRDKILIPFNSKFSDEHPLHFCRGVPPPTGEFQTNLGIAWCKEIHFFSLHMSRESEKKNALANTCKFMK